MKVIKDYTHTGVEIEDIRLKRGKNKNDDFFAIKVKNVDDILYVNYNIFNDRVKAYFLGKLTSEIGRDLLLGLKWNFIITQGHYLKIIERGKFEAVSATDDKSYVSVLEIAGVIGDFKNNFGSEVKVLGTHLTEA